MKIVTYNIQWGKGRDGRIDLDRIARTIRGADVIALQEVERHWRPQAHPDQAARLATLLPDHHWVFGPAMDLAGEGRGARRQVGNMTLSRFPISATRNLPLPSRPAPGEVNDTQAMLECVIEAARPFRLCNAHLNYLDEALRLEQLDLMLALIIDAPARGGPITLPGRPPGPQDDWIYPPPDGRYPGMPEACAVLGDFNCEPGSATYRAMTARGFQDGLALAGFEAGEGVTFPANGRERAQRLDHIFLNGEMVPGFRGAHIDERADGSDHQPVWIELDIES